MSWLAVQPGVSCVLAGATTAEQVTTNAAAAEWALGPEDLEAVEEALRS
jgi:aryl-alcohol dehydrogenase-like predicted oxidoreductase